MPEDCLTYYKVILVFSCIRKNVLTEKFCLSIVAFEKSFSLFDQVFRKIDPCIGASFRQMRKKKQPQESIPAAAVQYRNRMLDLPDLRNKKAGIVIVPAILPCPQKIFQFLVPKATDFNTG